MSQLPPLTALKASLSSSGHLLHIELDHGRANEMGSPQLSDWEALTDWLPNSSVRAVITFSRRRSRRGTPIFIAGANVTERVGWSDAEVRTHVRWQRSVLRRLRAAPVFHIAVVDGVALGWGAEMMIAVDYRIAGPGASFALPETGIGILPGAGGTSELWAMIGVPQAMRLGMTGERIDADEAHRIGLIQERAESLEAGLARAEALAQQVARRSPTAIGAFKQAMLAGIGQTSEARAELEARAYELCLESGDAAVGRENFKAITSGEEVQWNERRLPSS
ncbi:MAG: enoyl-CoA hydratase/isomerase family protein [Myxococcota bacterium]|nr:enoyl-CoA hydratase/isomerase family protein [Myxococcota bacterium]